MPKPLVYKPKPGLRYEENGTSLYLGDCLDILKTLESDSLDAVVTDPPAGISFMGKQWDHNKGGRDSWIDWLTRIMAECLRVLKPGGHALVWSIPRTSHWTGTAIEEAGFEVRNCVYHIFGCLSEDTEILVDGQWEPYQKAVAGRLALCYDIGNGTYSWQPIQRLYVYDYDDTAYRLVSDSTDQIVSRGHRCLVERCGEQVFQEAETLQRQENVPILENLRSLLEALPMPDERASGSQEDLFVGVCGEKVCGRESRQTFGATCEMACAEVPRVRQENRDSCSASGIQQEELLQQTMSSNTCYGSDLETSRIQGTCCLDREVVTILCGENERCKESCMERGSDLLPQARQLQAHQVCSLPTGAIADGPQGWLCDGASSICGSDNRTMPLAVGGSTPQEPQPPGQSAGQPPTICQQPGSQAVRGEWFTSTTLATVTQIHYIGKVWCVKVPTGAFVARRNGKVFVTGNSGFPKSLDVSKAIDKAAGAEREVVAASTTKNQKAIPSTNAMRPRLTHPEFGDNVPVTAPVTDAARQWQGWGTCLKPAVETWWLARKPIEKGCTVAANVLKHGTGALNIDGCRIDGAPPSVPQPTLGVRERVTFGFGTGTGRNGEMSNAPGRFPANLVLSHHPECVCLGTKQIKGTRGEADYTPTGNQGPVSVTRNVKTGAHYADADGLETVASWDCHPDCPIGMFPETYTHPGVGRKTGINHSLFGNVLRKGQVCSAGNSGSAARFFYCSKASRSDRGEGNIHPTVKPTALMRYLVRLVTPPGGVVLDPFLGSGSTAVACLREGFRCLGIEQDEATLKIAIRRVEGEVNA